VVLIEHQTYDFVLQSDYIKEWFLLTLDRIGASEAAIKLLAKKGFRRIALVHKDIAEKDHPVLRGYKSGLIRAGLGYSAWLDFDTLNTSDEMLSATIADFYKKNNFDALLLEPRVAFRVMQRKHSLNRCFNLPANVKIMTVDSISCNQTTLQPVSSMEFPYEEIGRFAAMRLLEDDFCRGQQIFSSHTVERESAVHETEQLAELAVL
jgi:DNA-binding LacI/PurR family transcriptional regulator